MPDRFESGTHNTPGIAGLCAGLSFIKSKGIDKIRAHEQELVKYFLDGLADIKNVKVYGIKEISKQAPVVSINIGDTGSSEISYILDPTLDI